jgi:DNA polymerase-3 subunit delta
MAESTVYYIWGEEEYLIEAEISRIVQELANSTGEPPERLSIDADELDGAGLARTLEFSPLFSMNRVVIIRRPNWLDKSNRKSKKTDDICRVLKDYLYSEGQAIIITCLENNTANPIVKLLTQKANVIHCQKPDSKRLASWIKDEFKRCHRKVSPPAVALLARSGFDMFYLQHLIEKLCLLTDNEITEKEVQQQLTVKQEINVFKLIDTVMNRDLNGAMQAYEQLLVQGEHPIYLLYMIGRQFFLLAQVKCYREQGLQLKQIADTMGQKEFTVRKMMDKCNRFTHEELKEVFALLLDADISFKTSGKNPDIVMELLLAGICSHKK